MKTYRQHVKSDGVKWVVTTIAILLIGVILTGIITEGFTDFNPYCWFGHEYGEDGICIKCGAEKPAEDPDKDPDGQLNSFSGLQIVNGNSHAMALYSAAPEVKENNVITQQLTAHITPADADNQRVTWSVAWQNPESEFATGKTVTDYVTVTPESDGSLTATVTCLKDFGEKIVVEVRCEDVDINGEHPFATAVCDYLQRVKGFTFTPDSTGLEFPLTSYTYDVEYTNYTIATDINVVIEPVMTLDQNFSEAIEVTYSDLETKYGVGSWSYAGVLDEETETYYERSCWTRVDYEAKTISFLENDFVSNFVEVQKGNLIHPVNETVVKTYVNLAFRNTVESYQDTHATFTVSYSLAYADRVYDSGDITVRAKFNSETLKVNVAEITLSDSQIIF